MAKYIVEIPDEVEINDKNLCPFDMCRPSWWGEAYQKGLEDAWEAARRIVGMTVDERCVYFNGMNAREIMNRHIASEAIERLIAWEQKQDEICVGDEVQTDTGSKGVVVSIPDTGCWVFMPDYEAIQRRVDKKSVRKTGRHFPQVEELLEQMREEE